MTTECTPTKWCDALDAVANGHNGTAMGINSYLVVHVATGRRRVLVGARSKANKNGSFFNFCPFCGVKVNEIAAYEGEAEALGVRS